MVLSTTIKQDEEFCFISEASESISEASESMSSNSPILYSNNSFQNNNKTEKYLCIDVGFKNLSWCLLENSENSLNKTIYEHGVQSIYSKKVNLKIDWEEVNANLHTLFQEDFPLLYKYQNQIKGIYIERQPRANIKNCLLAATIYTFFYNQMKNIRREEQNFWFNVPIEYMDSRKKLSSDTLLFLEVSSTSQKTYYQRKKEAVRRVMNLLENECIVYRNDFFLEKKKFNTKFSFEMNSKNKKDDLADSLLMCYFIAVQKDKKKLPIL